MDKLPQWQVMHLNHTVEQEFLELPKALQAKFLRLAALVEEFGLEMIGEPYVKHLEGKLWEMRVKASAGHGRGIYCAWVGRQVVVLRYFIKKSPKTPARELATARRRFMELKEKTENE